MALASDFPVHFIVYAIGGLAGLVTWAWRMWVVRGYKSWPMTIGTVEQHFEVDEGALGRQDIHYYIAYSYEANGEYYSGNIETSAWQEFPIGMKIDVYFNQDDPSISVGKKSAALTATA